MITDVLFGLGGLFVMSIHAWPGAVVIASVQHSGRAHGTKWGPAPIGNKMDA